MNDIIEDIKSKLPLALLKIIDSYLIERVTLDINIYENLLKVLEDSINNDWENNYCIDNIINSFIENNIIDDVIDISKNKTHLCAIIYDNIPLEYTDDFLNKYIKILITSRYYLFSYYAGGERKIKLDKFKEYYIKELESDNILNNYIMNVILDYIIVY